jgi:CheY-like chemotaxis protein
MAKILVGAIDRNTRELIVFSLRFAGHGLLSAANREECLNLARQNKPDVILVDNNIAGMGGD